ncbi:RNA recognition motif-containing protein [Didymosphaeria variabile]|uniref:RNA recognition motif-containing protein n=1 Tax=Didymosphaeria variabile TaxID=1932322 RepID=A0A9W9C967_9PLEO|nr:RNA recognition motif-containing protein [Didymosphaeria variabile]KAJ4351774.1 RNA recognition motif-containing protein [Didymosphaeria variabile]
MAPRRKRQRLSEDGASATTALADADEPSHTTASPSKATQSRRQLFVRSLASSVTTEDLTDFFSENYPIKYALVVLDKETKASKGYGFVTFADAEDAQRAKEELDGADLQGKKIKVEVAEARHRDADTAAPAVSAGARARAEREQAIKENQAPKLIVRNLPWSIKTPEQLQKLFLSYGKVHFTKLPKKPTGELRGFGFVALRGKKNAEKAMEELNGKEIDGRQIAVDWAVDKDAWQDLQKQLDAEEVRQKDESKEGDEDEDENDRSSAEGSEEDDDAGSDDENEDDSNTDYEDVSDSDEEGGIALEDAKPRAPDYTVFIRNLPFTADDDSLFEHFKQFGPIAYARVVMDHETDRPKGTGFVRFYKEEDMIDCLKGVPSTKLQRVTADRRDGTQITIAHSVLENEDADPTGRYTMDGRVLQISRAVDKTEAVRLTAEGQASRFNRDKDKRRLYLLSEGTLDTKSPLYQKLSPSEIKMRQESADQRKKQIEKNPSLHLSLTRLAVRNLPRTVTSKDLKALARQAIVGFAADVKEGKRQRLSAEELARGGDAMLNAEKARKRMGKGIVKQAKVVFETPAGSKITEESGAGRSRGYGFIEFYTHRSALMGLRWLNGHAVDYKTQATQPKSKKAAKEEHQDKKKRLIVEFAIENANVVARRSDRESKAKDPKPADKDGEEADSGRERKGDKKRKRESGTGGEKVGKRKDQGSGAADAGEDAAKSKLDAKAKQRAQIIQKKRMARRTRKQGKA